MLTFFRDMVYNRTQYDDIEKIRKVYMNRGKRPKIKITVTDRRGKMGCHGSLTATDSLYKPQTLIKTGFQSYFFVNLLVVLCSYL